MVYIYEGMKVSKAFFNKKLKKVAPDDITTSSTCLSSPGGTILNGRYFQKYDVDEVIEDIGELYNLGDDMLLDYLKERFNYHETIKLIIEELLLKWNEILHNSELNYEDEKYINSIRKVYFHSMEMLLSMVAEELDCKIEDVTEKDILESS